MTEDLKVAIIGLDTSHAVEFARRMQAPDCAPEMKVAGMKAVSCLRFATPFMDEAGLDERQKQLEAWGVQVTTDLAEAVADCDALMLEINDPAYHLEYFQKCAGLGKPIFLDKPMADTLESGRAIYDLAQEKGVRVLSCSSLRFAGKLQEACAAVPEPRCVSTFGPLGIAPAGSSIVWYGVHAFEMLQRALGRGAEKVFARRDCAGVVTVIEYGDGRRGVVELTEGAYHYGGCLRGPGGCAPFVVDGRRLYSDQLEVVHRFFQGEAPPLELEDTLEVMALLDAAERSSQSGSEVVL
jgi:predicted dehydrogenase